VGVIGGLRQVHKGRDRLSDKYTTHKNIDPSWKNTVDSEHRKPKSIRCLSGRKFLRHTEKHRGSTPLGGHSRIFCRGLESIVVFVEWGGDLVLLE
jgi:hypothetical protein